MNRRIGPLAAIGLVGACYSYTPAGPVESVTPKLGQRVLVTLTREGVATLSMKLGPQATYVEGDVLAADSAGLRLAVRRVENARRIGTEWIGERVTLPRDLIARVSERHFSVGATALLSGLALGGVIGAYAAFGSNSGATEGGGLQSPNPTQ